MTLKDGFVAKSALAFTLIATLAGCQVNSSTTATSSKTPGAPQASTHARAASRFRTFGDGQHVVGSEIKPGTYRTREGSSGCYWAREKDFEGGVDSLLANDNTDFPAVVTIMKTDKGFESTDCGTWTTDLSAITSSRTRFGDGIYIVGTDMIPGTYKSSGHTGCYWERMSNFTGGLNGTLANDNTDSSAVVTIRATDKGFKSSDCGSWRRIG